MRLVLYLLIAAFSGAAIIVANPTNGVGKLLHKYGILEGMMQRYSANPEDEGDALGAEDTLLPPSLTQSQEPAPAQALDAPPPAPPQPIHRDPQVARLTALIENLETEARTLKLKIQAIEANRPPSKTLSAESKTIQKEIDAISQRISIYQSQLAAAVERDKASR